MTTDLQYTIKEFLEILKFEYDSKGATSYYILLRPQNCNRIILNSKITLSVIEENQVVDKIKEHLRDLGLKVV